MLVRRTSFCVLFQQVICGFFKDISHVFRRPSRGSFLCVDVGKLRLCFSRGWMRSSFLGGEQRIEKSNSSWSHHVSSCGFENCFFLCVSYRVIQNSWLIDSKEGTSIKVSAFIYNVKVLTQFYVSFMFCSFLLNKETCFLLGSPLLEMFSASSTGLSSKFCTDRRLPASSKLPSTYNRPSQRERERGELWDDKCDFRFIEIHEEEEGKEDKVHDPKNLLSQLRNIGDTWVEQRFLFLLNQVIGLAHLLNK